ncbi:hypothetical protein D3C76_1499670 [compost metagenome]
MRPLVVVCLDAEASPIARRPRHKEVANHHVIFGIQEDQRPLIGGNRLRKGYVSILDLVRTSRPLKADVQASAVANRQYLVD